MISHFGRVEFCVTLWTERVQGGSVGKESTCNAGNPGLIPGWHLLKGNPVEEGTTRRGTDTLVHRPEKPADSKHSSTSCLFLP